MPDDPGIDCPACEAKIILNGDITARVLDSTCERIDAFVASGNTFPDAHKLVVMANKLEDDAFAFTNMLTPRDLSRCAVGQGKYVVITAEDGGIINDPVLLRLGENHFWLALADSDLLLWARGVALNSGLRVQIREPDVSPLQVQGPKAKEVVNSLFGDRMAQLRYYHFLEASVDGIPVVVTGVTRGQVHYLDPDAESPGVVRQRADDFTLAWQDRDRLGVIYVCWGIATG